jgi:hypothetical protein
VIFSKKKSVSLPQSKFVSITLIKTSQPILGLEEVKNLGSRLKPSIGFHTQIWAFSGFFWDLICIAFFSFQPRHFS